MDSKNLDIHVDTKWVKDHEFVANVSGHEIIMSSNYEIGSSPKQMLLASLAGCTGLDVVDMLKKLVDKKLIQYEKAKGVKLTGKGMKIAIGIVRRHRLWEVFLLEKLEYSWDEVHEIAEQLEHIHHPELADRLDKFLGNPQYDPHGDPIPSASGEMADVHKTILSEVAEGKTCQVVGVKDTSSSFLQYLKKLDIGIGTKITLVEKIDFDGSVIISIKNGTKTTVSKMFADNLLVHD
jgi:DtxR family Mn-dependent transcriptional regulator